MEHHHGIFRVTGHPVVLTEIGAHEDAQPLEHLVSDTIAEVFVDGRKTIDIEQDDRQWLSEPSGSVHLFCQDGVERHA